MEYWRRRRINRKQHIWMVSIFGLDDRGCFLCFSLFLVLQQQQTWTGLINSCRSLNGCSHPFLVTLLPFIIQLQHFSWFQQLFFQAFAQSDASLSCKVAQRDNLCHCYWALPDSDQWDIQSLWSRAITQITTFSAMCNAIVAMWQCYNGTHKILFQ